MRIQKRTISSNVYSSQLVAQVCRKLKTAAIAQFEKSNRLFVDKIARLSNNCLIVSNQQESLKRCIAQLNAQLDIIKMKRTFKYEELKSYKNELKCHYEEVEQVVDLLIETLAEGQRNNDKIEEIRNELFKRRTEMNKVTIVTSSSSLLLLSPQPPTILVDQSEYKNVQLYPQRKQRKYNPTLETIKEASREEEENIFYPLGAKAKPLR